MQYWLWSNASVLERRILFFVLFLVLGAVSFFVLRWLKSRQPVSEVYDIPTHNCEMDNLTIHYHQSGRGPPLVLLHGIGANLYCWRWVLPILRSHFSVLALDLPGFGQSSKPLDAHFGLDDQVERVIQFLDRMKIKQFYLVGSSMGGNIALWLAKKHRDRVLGIAVIGPATSARLAPMSLKNWQWLASPISHVLNRHAMRWAHRRTVSKKDRVDQTRVEQTFKTYGGKKEAVRSFMLATEAIRDSRLPEKLKSVPHEVLVLWGSQDRLVPRKIVDQLAGALRRHRLLIHEGGGHHLQEDEPEWVADKVIEFFSLN